MRRQGREMWFETLCKCTNCGESEGDNCLPVKSYVCPRCGNSAMLCPLCYLDPTCPLCKSRMYYEWESFEDAISKNDQEQGHATSDNRGGS